MRVAIEDLALSRLFVVYPGDTHYALDDPIEVAGLTRLERTVGTYLA
jgi:hypothetical protein